MTEKRFEVIEDDDFDIEYISDKDSFGKSISSMYTCCDIMNKLNEENEQLKHKINDLLYQIEYVGKNNKSCEKCECFIEDIEYCWMWDMNVKKEDIVVACDKRKVMRND